MRAAARPVLIELAELSRETVILAVRDADEVINVEQISGPHLVRDANWAGRRTPLHCAANGKALLMLGPPAEIERLLAQPLARFTERTIADLARLRADLAAACERGLHLRCRRVEDGLNGAAAPARDAAGQALAAVSISGPSYRVTPDRLADLGALQAAAKIAGRLGYSG